MVFYVARSGCGGEYSRGLTRVGDVEGVRSLTQLAPEGLMHDTKAWDVVRSKIVVGTSSENVLRHQSLTEGVLHPSCMVCPALWS